MVDGAPQYVRTSRIRSTYQSLTPERSKFLPEEEWLLDDLYLGYGFDTPVTRRTARSRRACSASSNTHPRSVRRPPRKMNMSTEEMREANIPVRLRSWCAHHVMPLHKCRMENYWLPYKCEHEREMFEKCRYKEYAVIVS